MSSTQVVAAGTLTVSEEVNVLEFASSKLAVPSVTSSAVLHGVVLSSTMVTQSPIEFGVAVAKSQPAVPFAEPDGVWAEVASSGLGCSGRNVRSHPVDQF